MTICGIGESPRVVIMFWFNRILLIFSSIKTSWFLTGIDRCHCWNDKPRGYCLRSSSTYGENNSWLVSIVNKPSLLHAYQKTMFLLRRSYLLGFIYLHVLIFIYSCVLPYVIYYKVQCILCVKRERIERPWVWRLVSLLPPQIWFVGGAWGG